MTARPLQTAERAAVTRLLEGASRAAADQRIHADLHGQLLDHLASTLGQAATVIRGGPNPENAAVLDAATGRLARYCDQLAKVGETS